ncbi:uncharacterized protein LOC125242596 [Leguminivora glycinivorella]|uniref:uncharacterized protein LOC125242596 n=1 Tax=Leguminivora glycinivorella TaxID=1035111 RepID=UPI00200E74D4|nr:uncharacterized protein LOC125242596 [Leguminivora glycinivorella]XP_048007343.1 uncharacterized protein LOC125242596 [Leguminivora glycinivorella]
MEIRRWLLCVVVNCVIVTHLVAKPVSLNELIAAERKQKQEQHTKPSAIKRSKTVSLNELLAAESNQHKQEDNSKITKSEPRRAKTVSLNELIAAESKQQEKKSVNTKSGIAHSAKPFSTKESSPSESRQNLERSRFPKILAKIPRRKPFFLKDLFATEKSSAKHRIGSLLSKTPGGGLRLHSGKFLPSLSHKPFESAENIFSLARTISPLQFRKRFEIRSPLKPRKIKYSFTPRNKRRNQSAKREADDNAVFNHRYIPLIRRIGLLVDGILSPDSSESVKPVRRRKPRRNQRLSGKDADLASSESKPQKKTVAALTTVPPQTTDTEDPTTEASDATTNTTPFSDIYTLRPHTDLPLPSTGNTSSDWGDDNGVSERSSTTFHGDIERHIARYNGSDEYNSSGRNETYSPSNEEDSSSPTRVDKCSDGHGTGTTRNRSNNKTEEETETTTRSFVRRNDTDAKATLQIGGETLQIPRNVRRLPGLPDKVFIVDAEPVPAQKFSEESFVNVAHHHASTERGTDGNGTDPAEDKGIRQVIQGLIPINDIIDPFLKQRTQDNHVVAIFDGYSMARDINGRNKLTEKTIRISPN